VRAGAKLVWNVNLIRQVWLEDVFGVGFDLVSSGSGIVCDTQTDRFYTQATHQH